MKSTTASTAHGTTASTDHDEWLTPADIAKEMKMTTAWAYAEIAAGRLASVRLGKFIRVRRSDLTAYLAERGNGGEA